MNNSAIFVLYSYDFSVDHCKCYLNQRWSTSRTLSITDADDENSLCDNAITQVVLTVGVDMSDSGKVFQYTQ